MGSDRDRRATNATRIAFEGIVELGGEGTAFEARGVDLSTHGMHLRTAYLPEIGQELSCRFDAGPLGSVVATGEVVWLKEAPRGGEFGLQFVDLDEESLGILRTMMSAPDDGAQAGSDPNGDLATLPALGSRVRLHIEGLGQPMRAKVKAARPSRLLVGSELGFLRVGRDLEIEDAQTGEKRPAAIERVQVEVNDARVPELIVSLRYPEPTSERYVPAAEDVDARPMAPEGGLTDRPSIHDRVTPTVDRRAMDRAAEAVDVEVERTPLSPPPAMSEGAMPPSPAQQHVDAMREAFAKSAAKVAPALAGFAARAKTTVEILSHRSLLKKDKEDEAPPRRTTAPPPRGGLHAMGRKVVRDDVPAEVEPSSGRPRLDRRKLALGAAGGAALILLAVAFRKPATPPAEVATAEPAPSASVTAPAEPGTVAALDPAAAPPIVPGLAPPQTPALSTATVTTGTEIDDAWEDDRGSRTSKRKVTSVAPFGQPVGRANVLRLKMDGPIEKIQGAVQPTGFTVVVPERHSLEPAAPLASKDGRIAAIRVANDPGGAELSVTFKDGVPLYQVRARGDVLEIALASAAGSASDGEESHPATARVNRKHNEHHAKKKHKKH